MYSKRHFLLFLPVLVLVTLLTAAWVSSPAAAPDSDTDRQDRPLNPEETVVQAWQAAISSGTYSYDTSVEHTEYPIPRLSNSGRQPSTSFLAIAGQTDQANELLEMTIWQDAGRHPDRGLTVKVENGQTYSRSGGGEWELIDDITTLFAPDHDPLGFLATIQNVSTNGQDVRQFGEVTRVYDRYTFELDGDAYAVHMERQIRDHLQQFGSLPPGIRFSSADIYRRATGQGEIWLDSDGLPARMTMNLDVPAYQENGRAVSAITTDLSGFDRVQIETAAVQAAAEANITFLKAPQQWLTLHHADITQNIQIGLTTTFILLASYLIVVLALRYWRTKKFHATISSILIFSIVVPPLIMAQQAQAFNENLANYQHTQQQKREDATALEEAKAQLEVSDWDAHADPLESNLIQAEAAAFKQSRYNALSVLATTNNSDLVDTSDSDGDGLLDADEEFWGTCAYPLNSTEYNGAATCAGITDPTDTDGDTLTDGVEVNDLGSSPFSRDTDQDGLADNLEVGGFEYGGQTWYPAFNDDDTNNDGIVDGLECLVWYEADDTYDPTAACPDTDNDGTPDLFDEDNDGDFVPDGEDLSRNTRTSTNFDYDNPFLFRADNLEEDKVFLLDLQFRPTFAENLNLHNHVLDWPSNDTEGQITRYLDTTWADTANSTIQSDDDNASNGDIRLVPMLEITMPYSDGHYASLPITPTAPADRVLGNAVDSWLDADQLDPFSITVEDITTDSGELVAYVPLVPVADEYDTTVAYASRMLYRPMQGTNGTADWGADHEFRIAWIVQMITDQCINEDDDPDTCDREDVLTVVHSYYETWELTGLSGSEEHGLESAIVYEDPAQDDDLNTDDQLWLLSWNLGNTFMRGRDCEILSGDTCAANTDGERDVTVANLDSSIDEWLTSGRYLTVENHSYDHSSYMAYLTAYEATDILETEFTPYASNTIPTLMYVHESETRSVNLDDQSSSSANSVALDFDPSAVNKSTTAYMSWAPYDYVGGTWTGHDTESYLDILEARLELDDYFQPADDSPGAENEARGKVLWAQMYYSSLMAGATSLIEIDSQTIFTPTFEGPLSELDFDSVVPSGATSGMTSILAAYANVLVGFYTGRKAQTATQYFSSIGQTWQDVVSPYRVNINKQFKSGLYLHFNTNVLTGLVLVAAVVGAALLAVGYFSGNDTVFRAGVIILSVVTIVVVGVYMANAIVAIRGAIMAANATVSSVQTVASRFQAVGALAFAVGIALAWGMFAYQALQGGVSAFEMNTLLSYAIASTIVTLALFVLDILGFGLIGMILAIIDGILAILGEQTATEFLTELIAEHLYDVRMVVTNLKSSDRLDIDMRSFELGIPELGFAIDNRFLFTYGVTNTLKFDNDTFNRSTAEDRTVFVYDLQTSPDSSRHLQLDQGDMTNSWTDVGGRKMQTTDMLDITIPLLTVGIGVNRTVDFYLIESYYVSYEGCWFVDGMFEADACHWGDTTGYSPINLGASLVYDILPETVEQFARMDWDDALPTQVDSDADGLPNTDGTDPNDREADTDGDGLLDIYELSYGLDYQQADGDNDGLNDAEELDFNTNPFLSDTDGDGLNDYIETQEGWLVLYNGNQLTRVYSDPNTADIDEDGLDDLDEFLFGFNPWVATDPSIIDTLVEFNDLTVQEETNLQMLFRMEESVTAQVFVDSSGKQITGSCDDAAGRCPTAEVTGRYGDSLFFDGTDYVVTDMALDVNQFTMAAWIYNAADDDNFHNIMGAQASDLDSRAPSMWVHNRTKIHAGISDGSWDSFTTGNILTQNRWQHVAATYDGETYIIYVDGVPAYTTTSLSGTDSIPFDGYNIGATSDTTTFEGNIDEAAFFDTALSATEINALMNGRYNPNDLYVAPGTELTYRATVTNATSTNATGFLVPETGYIEPAMPNVQLALSFEDEQRFAFFENSITTDDAPFFCTAAEDVCPATGKDGPIGRAIGFDGVNDYLSMPGLIGRIDESYSILFWLYVESIPSGDDIAMILDTESTADGAMDIYLNSSGKMVIDSAERGTITSNYNFGNNLNQWVHVAYNGTNLHINTNKNGSGFLGENKPLTVGYGRLGNSMDGNSPFHGQIDELLVINDNLADGTGGGSSAVDEIEQLANGKYVLHHGNDDHNIVISEAVYSFEEVIDFEGTSFFNDISSGANGVCTPPACPTLTESDEGFVGRAILFDGVDDSVTQVGSHYSDFDEYMFYIKPLSYPAAGEVAYLYDTSATGSDENYSLNLYLDENGQIVYDNDVFTLTVQTAVTLNDWNQIRVWYNGNSSKYNARLSVNGSRVAQTTCAIDYGCRDESHFIRAGTMGNNSAGDSPFHGYIDEVSMHIATYSFDAPFNSVAYQNVVNELRSASCNDYSLCASVAPGKYGDGVYFDGNDDYLTLGQVLNPAETNFTAGFWFNAEENTARILYQEDGNTWLGLKNSGQINTDLGGVALAGGAYSLNQWHYATVTYDGTTLKIYLDGALVNSAVRTIPAATGDLILGAAVSADDYFAGSVDELIVLTDAADEALIAFLMASTYPALETANDFEKYTAGPRSSLVVSGSARMADNLPTSRYQFDLEVEAALELQTQIDFPVIDNNSADIGVFVPFEDTPGSTIFDNLIPYDDGEHIEAQCYNNSCPTAGVRGIIGRAASFDGLDDFLEIDIPNGVSPEPGFTSASVWVKGTKGTILDSRSTTVDDNAIRVDFGRITQYNIDFDNKIHTYETTFDMPVDEWTHIVFTVDQSQEPDVGTVYINGQPVVTGTHFVDKESDLWTIGANFGQQNYFEGKIDDLRVYETHLTAADVLALYEESAPILRFEFDEDDTAISFADESANGFVGYPLVTTSFNSTLSETVTLMRPAPGADGKIGNTALFAGNGYIEIEGTDPLGSRANDVTIMAWVKPENVSSLQRIVSSGRATTNDGIGFGLNGDGLILTTYGVKDYNQTASLVEGLWQHVVVTLDSNHDAHFYVNGELIGTVGHNTAGNINRDDPLFIGVNQETNGDFTEYFNGQIDELAVYGRTLTAAEINGIFLQEYRWYRANSYNELQVDLVPPTIEYLSDAMYRAPGYIQLSVATRDTHSYISTFDFGIKGPNDSGFSWISAPTCGEAVATGRAWCPYFDTADYGGEGVYEFQFRAVDAVGNETTSSTYTIYVDGQAPTSTTQYNDQFRNANEAGLLEWTVLLSGNISDPDIGSGLAGTGVVSNTMQIGLFDTSGGLINDGWQRVTLNGNNWSIYYRFAGERPSGVYTVKLTVADEMGNSALIPLGSILLDERPPTAAANRWALPSELITETTTLSGFVVEQPDWGDIVAEYHFETDVADPVFYDQSRNGFHATCLNTGDCPTADLNGPFGQAITFDGVDDGLTIADHDTLDFGLNDDFTVAVWVNAAAIQSTTAAVDNSIVEKWSDSGGYPFVIRYMNQSTSDDGQIRVGRSNGSSGAFIQSAKRINDGNMHHIVFAKYGDTLSLYIDGVLEGKTLDLTSGTVTNDSPLYLGRRGDSTDQFFTGSLDELYIYDHALTEMEIYGLAQSEFSEVSSVEVLLERHDLSSDAGDTEALSGAWETVTVNNGAWHYDMPTNTDGDYYTAKLRTTDNNGNTAEEGIIWRGTVDDKAPSISASSRHVGSDSTRKTEHTFTFSDYVLDLDTLVYPCDASDLTTIIYADDGLPQNGEPYQVEATCIVDGHATSHDLTACDFFGQCATITVTPSGGGDGAVVTIDTPAAGVTLVENQRATIMGFAYDPMMIDQIQLFADGASIGYVMIDPADPLTDPHNDSGDEITWEFYWTPDLIGEVELEVVMNGSGDIYTDKVTIYINEEDDTAWGATAAVENGTDLRLSWPQLADYCLYEVHQSDTPYFEPVSGTRLAYANRDSSDYLVSDGLVGGPWYYVVEGIRCHSAGGGIDVSNEIGVFGMPLVPGD